MFRKSEKFTTLQKQVNGTYVPKLLPATQMILNWKWTLRGPTYGARTLQDLEVDPECQTSCGIHVHLQVITQI